MHQKAARQFRKEFSAAFESIVQLPGGDCKWLANKDIERPMKVTGARNDCYPAYIQQPEFLAAKEVAAMLGVSRRTAQRLMREQAIHSFKVGEKLWRTTRQAVLEYAERESERIEPAA